MTRVVVPVRYPLTEHSIATLRTAFSIADEHDAHLTVLHVDLYHTPREVRRTDLQRAAEGAVGHRERTRYSVRKGLLVEETILDEVAAEEADIVVIGQKQMGRWRRMVRRLLDDPDVEAYLRDAVDCEVVTASP